MSADGAVPRPSFEPTAEQRDAIGLRGTNLLVSAAAGAGKTTVLVERVVAMLLDGSRDVDVDRLLVVTFTEAAAAEMRDRISRALEAALAERPGDPRIRRQLTLLGRASISTLHSFCLALIRQHFHRIGLDPGLGVMGAHEGWLTRLEVVDELFAEHHDRGEAVDFPDLVLAYGGTRSDRFLKGLVLELYEYAWTLPAPETWLERALAVFEGVEGRAIDATPFWPLLRRRIGFELRRALTLLALARATASTPEGPAGYVARLDDDVAALEACLERLAGGSTWGEAEAALGAMSFGRLPPAKKVDPRLKERAQKLRGQAKDAVKKIGRIYFEPGEQRWLDDLAALAPRMRCLTDLVRSFSERYAAEKRRRSEMDFLDLERLALEVLAEPESDGTVFRPGEVARDLRAYFAEVLVDEYQDINPVQEAILALVSQERPDGVPNRFLVGDVKQSIYGFRHTDPRLFLDKYRAYGAGGGGRRVLLGRNYRSRPSLIDGVNFLFRQIMNAAVGGIDYDRDAELVCGATYPEPDDGPASSVELLLLERGGDGEGEEGELPDAAEREAGAVAARIQALVGEGAAPEQAKAHVWDRDLGAMRPLRYGDVVILLRTARVKTNTFVDVLRRAGIPAHAEVATGWFQATEVEVVLAVLALIDNPRQDIPLAAVLRSPLVGLTASELARIRLAHPRGAFLDAVRAKASEPGEDDALGLRLASFLERLSGWRTAARRGPPSLLVQRIYDETRFVDVAAAMPGGEQRRSNLLALLDRAREFDRFARQGLFRLLRFLDKLRDVEGDLGAAPPASAGEDVVQISTIHKAKGLEYPVVFVVDLGKRFNEEDLRGDLLFHRELGFGPKSVDLDRRVKYASIAHHAVVAAKQLDLRAEEMRVLYVALTRAKERLILVGSASGLADRTRRWVSGIVGHEARALPESVLGGAESYLDWIVPALARHPDGAPLRELADLGPGAAAVDLLPPAGSSFRVGHPIELGVETPSMSSPAAEANANAHLWERMARLEPLGEPLGPWRDEGIVALEDRLRWRYPHASSARRFAKLTVSELERRSTAESDRDEESEVADATRLPGDGGVGGVHEGERASPYLWVPRLEERPRFLEDARETLTSAEIGTATHLVLEHLDLAAPLDMIGVAEQIDDLVRRGLLGAVHASAVDVASICDLFAGEPGSRLVVDPGRVRREVPFTLALDAAEIHDDPALAPGDDVVVVQGVIDALMEREEGDGFVLIDFKTGARARDPRGASELADRAAIARYRGQVTLYRRAVEEIYGRPVQEAFLCFLDLRRSLLVP